MGLQLKTIRRKQPSALELPAEVRKPGPKRLLLEGGTYVLVWSQDLNPLQREAVEVALTTTVAELLKEEGSDLMPLTAVWDAQTIAALCGIHPAPAVDVGLLDFENALTLDEVLSILHADERPYRSDEFRDAAVEQLQLRISDESDDSLLLQVHGDPGVGKTRLVAHGLDIDGVRDLVLYVNGTESLTALLNRLARNRESHGILFVDEVDSHTATNAAERISALRGRWRLVTVTSRGEAAWMPSSARNLVLKPLSAEAMRALIEEHSGLDSSDARRVAEVASGFPELAFRLADELRADPTLDLVHLARLPQPASILARALSDEETRRHIAPISLFSAIGFEGELRSQLEDVAAAFDLDVAKVEHHAERERELGRFVSRVGRYRQVTPLLVAVWLATDLIERTPGFADKVFSLPQPLQDAFVHQLDFFGPDVPHLPAALAHIIEDERFRRPESFDEAAGRLLRASAAITPSQVVDAIGVLIDSSSAEQLQSIPRRDLVWALEVLLWWPETWSRAVEALYRLARNENETWANNATGQFSQTFSLYLAGTTVPYQVRAEWLRAAIQKAKTSDLPLLGSAVSAGLSSHHSRTVVGFHGGGEPEDWQPETTEELVDSRRLALTLLVEILDRADERKPHVESLGDAVRVMFASGLVDDIDEIVRGRTWTARERSLLAARIRDVVKYDDRLPPEYLEKAVALQNHLLGANLQDRLPILIDTPIWELHMDRDAIHGTPRLLEEAAQAITDAHDGVSLLFEVGRESPSSDTYYVLCRLVADRIGAQQFGEMALEASDWVALAAALSVADAGDGSQWATSVLNALSTSNPDRVPMLLRSVSLSDARVEMGLDLVTQGKASASDLAPLLWGARVRPLGEATAIRLISTVGTAGHVEEALGMLDQWLEANPDPSAESKSVIEDLALAGIKTGGTMVEHHVERLVTTGHFPPDMLMDLFEERVKNREGLVDSLDRCLVDRIIETDAARLTTRFLELIRDREARSFGLFSATDLALLSRTARSLGADEVWGRIADWPEMDLRWALHHMDWRGTEPDSLVRTFLVSGRLSEVSNEAHSCFFNTLGVVSGPYHVALEGELERARAWRQHLSGTSAEEWADGLVKDYEAQIEWHKQREEEEFLNLR